MSPVEASSTAEPPPATRMLPNRGMSEQGGGGDRPGGRCAGIRIGHECARRLCKTACPNQRRGGLRRDRVGVGPVLRRLDHHGRAREQHRDAPAGRRGDGDLPVVVGVRTAGRPLPRPAPAGQPRRGVRRGHRGRPDAGAAGAAERPAGRRSAGFDADRRRGDDHRAADDRRRALRAVRRAAEAEKEDDGGRESRSSCSGPARRARC